MDLLPRDVSSVRLTNWIHTEVKVVLLPGVKDGEPPPQLLTYVDRRAIPVCCWGLDPTPVHDVGTDIERLLGASAAAPPFSSSSVD